MEHEHRRPVRPLDWPEATKTPAQHEFDLLAEMAKDPANHLEEIAPGVFKASQDDCPLCPDHEARGYWSSGPC